MAASTSSSMEEQQRLLDEEELQQQQQQQQQHQQLQPPIAKEKECIHKTKLIQFLGRPTPIILQNDNGPCPLLAICNVLLLRNKLNLSPDTAEVSQEKLLSLVAERLIDSNSNVNNKDAGYIENQQQNIADSIDLLPQLATGIDVNIKFRRIDDFEFTRECAIFDLLDIPLYHGWIVDPQDCDTADAISFKSYNSIMGELVALETQCSEKVQENNTDEEDSVDFAAATTAALGIPSPCLSKAMSFDGRTQIVADYQVGRKGDLEEEAELLRALKLSEAEIPNTTETIVGNDRDDAAVALGKPPHTQNIFPANIANVMEEHTSLATNSSNQEADGDSSNLSSNEINLACSRTLLLERVSSFTNTDVQDPLDQLKHAEPGDMAFGNQMVNNRNIESSAQVESVFPDAVAKHNGFEDENSSGSLGHGDQTENLLTPAFTVDTADDKNGNETPILSVFTGPNIDSDSSSGRLQQTDEREAFTPSVDGSEPIYEGEECILDPSKPPFEDREPVYEGEVVLAKQAGKSSADVQEVTSSSEITPHQGELIRNFLRNNASQLTIYGLFCLQDGLKERELCVFFRNNHFSTMFKYEGELYLLATDQGYINQPDLVWEKLNEVNGDTLFMTGNFREFKVDEQSSSNWDEHNAVASTADYIASIDNASQAGFDVNSDLQLAIALQQQEFEQQQQRNGSQQTSVNSSRLVTGPQVPRNNARYPSTTTNRADAKKSEKSDKCSIM